MVRGSTCVLGHYSVHCRSGVTTWPHADAHGIHTWASLIPPYCAPIHMPLPPLSYLVHIKEITPTAALSRGRNAVNEGRVVPEYVTMIEHHHHLWPYKTTLELSGTQGALLVRHKGGRHEPTRRQRHWVQRPVRLYEGHVGANGDESEGVLGYDASNDSTTRTMMTDDELMDVWHFTTPHSQGCSIVRLKTITTSIEWHAL